VVKLLEGVLTKRSIPRPLPERSTHWPSWGSHWCRCWTRFTPGAAPMPSLSVSS